MNAGNWPKYSHTLPYGWAGEYSDANTIGFELHRQKYEDIVKWIHTNVKRPYSNAHWAKLGDCIYVQLRRKKDWVWFTLRWA